VDGAPCEDITVVGVTMRGSLNSPLFFRLGSRMRGPSNAKIGTLKRILISNITSYGAVQLPSMLSGVPGCPIEDIKISDVYLHQVGGIRDALEGLQVPENEKGYPEPTMFGVLPATGFFIRHVDNLELTNVEIATEFDDARPALFLEEVASADLFRVKLPKHRKSDQLRLRGVSDFRFLGSRSHADVSAEHIKEMNI